MSTTLRPVTHTAEVEVNSAVMNGAPPGPTRAIGSMSRAVPTRSAAANPATAACAGRKCSGGSTRPTELRAHDLGCWVTSAHASGPVRHSVPVSSILHVAAALAALAVIALLVMRFNHIALSRDFLGAAVRSVLQLTVVALVVAWVFAHPAGGWLYVAVMLTAATATSARRVGVAPRGWWRIGGPIALGVVLAVGPVLALGALPFSARTALPFTAQIIGGAMTAVSLSGRRLRDDVVTQWETVEGFLALGATPRQATADIGRVAVERSLVPSLDQIRSAGLVVLPGAFVGMLLGGATPAEAAQVQLLVLFALFAAAVTAATSHCWLQGPQFGHLKPLPA